MVYFGIVNEQSLKNPQIINEFSIVARKQIDSWYFLLVVANEDELDSQVKKPQDHKVPIHEDCWYNHFFMSEKLFVVFQDTVMETTTNPGDWDEVIQYGVKHGIPLEQLTFNPRTKDDAFELFELE